LRAQGLDCARQSDAVGALVDRGEWPAELRQAWRLAGELAC
jgi:hypothetical protein